MQEKIEWQGRVIPAHPISLSAHQTVVLDIDELLKELDIKTSGIESGGLSIAHNGAPGALIAHGVVQNKKAHFASNLSFIDPAVQPSSTLNGTGLILARSASTTVFPGGSFFVPHLTLRNTLGAPQTASVTVQYTVGGSPCSQTLPVVNLAPHEVRLVDFSALLNSLGDTPIDDAGLRIESSGTTGSLIAQLTSIDQNSSMTVDVPLVSVSSKFIGTGAHPFHLEGDSQAALHLKNLAAEPTTAIVQVLYEGGEFSPELVPLAPGQSVRVDIRRLRDSRAKDVHGHRLPSELTQGQVQWFQHGKQSVIGRLVASSRSLGVSASFACGGVCCPPSFSSSWVNPGSLIGSPGDSFGLTVWETDETCGQFYGPYNITAYASCTSTDSSVAQVSGSSINLVGPGNCTINVDHLASTFTRQPGTDCESGPCEIVCDEIDTMMTDPVPVTARPTVVISGPAAVPLAGTMGILTPAPTSSVQLIGTGNPPGGTFSWSTSSPHVTLSNTSSDTVTVTSVSESSGPNDVAIVLIYAVNGRGNSATKQITVQKPTSMAFMSVDSQGPRSCANDPSTGRPAAGWTKVITWQLQDRWNQPIGSVPSYDTLTGSGQNSCFLTFAGTAPGGAVGPTGLWQHEYGICSTACPNGGTCTTLSDWNFFANGWQIVLPITFHCNSITVGDH